RKPAALDDVLLRLARSARAAGDARRASDAYARVYAEFPLGDPAAAARAELEKMAEWPPVAPRTPRNRLELDRAERLYTAQRVAEARAAFEALRPQAIGDDAELISLRIAECDYAARRYVAARDRLRPLIAGASRLAEARFYYLSAIRGLSDHVDYERLTRELVSDFPDSGWAEEALNALASHFVVIEEDERADATFREILAKYPNGRHAERAAWKAGWWAYKHGRYDDAAREFEAAASAFPRSDYRPAFLYWIARAHERLGSRAAADAAHRSVVAAYGTSYYGRMSARRLGTRAPQPAAELPGAILAAAARMPPTQELISVLLSLDLYDLALDELLFAQRTWGDSPVVDATLGWVHNRQGDLRKGVVAVKRAYPQYLAAGGDRLPVEMQRVIFPLDYWPLIQKYAAARNLDPYLMAALIAQESTFDAVIRSRANAIGLMQILPSTGRRYARQLGMRRFSAAMLTRPEMNIRIGMAYFADLVRRFGRVDFALAGYNAGENRIAQWRAERPGLEPDEFIDDVPFPETQNYLRKILGTAEDYRRLYRPASQPAPGGRTTGTSSSAKTRAAAKPAKPVKRRPHP
ncbi:MAG: transglycosylase SLT domain-containing protein, partial [Acidobacteria bacterium]|nr:transglycosylase SLT domain-containing protein [Acidobacteriota bacterium]